MSGGPIPFGGLDFTRRQSSDFLLLPVSYHSPTEEHDNVPYAGGGGQQDSQSPGNSPAQPPPPSFTYPFPDSGANAALYGQQFGYPPPPAQPHPYAGAVPLQQPYYHPVPQAQEPLFSLQAQHPLQNYPPQNYGPRSYEQSIHAQTASPPLEQLYSSNMYLHPPPPASDSSSSPEASEEPEVNAILIARDEQNEAYIRNKLRVPDSVPVNLDLVRQRGRERPEASL
ncbi:hypothetical protein EV122DRAFT_198429, partial [Schizophyllum commune]